MVAAAAAEPGRGRARPPGADVRRHGAAGRPLPAGQRGVGGHRAGPLPVRPQRPVRPAERADPGRTRLPRADAELPRHLRVRRGVRADAPRDRGRAGHRRLAARAELVRRTAGHLRRQLPRVRAVGAGHGPAAGTGRGHRAHRPARLQPDRVPQRRLRPVQLRRLERPDRSPGEHREAARPRAPGHGRTTAAPGARPAAGRGRHA